MRLIENIIDPQELLLSWQPSDPSDRMRRIVAKLVRQQDDADFIYLTDSSEFADAQNAGFEGYRGLDIKKPVHKNVLSVFMKRLPPRNRGDFGRYLEALRLPLERKDVSDFALLGYSGARLPDDDFTIIHPFNTAVPPFEFLLDVAGYRYHLKGMPVDSTWLDTEASFEREPENPYDNSAIRVVIQGNTAGYVCRGLLPQFHTWMNKGYKITAFVERLNGTSERPRLFLFVTVRAE